MVLALRSVAFDKILDRYVLSIAYVHLRDEHSCDQNSPVTYNTEGRIVSPIDLSGLDRRQSIFSFIFPIDPYSEPKFPGAFVKISSV
jgi:hypothetical protein